MSAMLKQKLIDIANGFTKYGLWKGGGSETLSELNDVTLTNLQKNDVLTYNGSEWVNDDNLQNQIDTLNSNLGNICNNFKSYEELTKDIDILITRNGIITFTLIFGTSTYSGYTFLVNSFIMLADANLDVASQNRQVTRSFRVFAGDTIQLQVNPNTTLNRFRIYYTDKSE